MGYDLKAEFIADKIKEFVAKNKPTKPIYIRLLVYPTSDLDISPHLHNIEFDFLIYCIELGDYLSGDGVCCTISSWQRQQDTSFPLRGKITGAYITSALAKTEAYNRGFDKVILMKAKGKVSEGSAMNIFIVRNGIIKTLPVTEDILEGITRDSVIKIAKKLGYEVQEVIIDKSELFIADAIKAEFYAIVSAESENFQDWITKIVI